jgi:hypothetical protein
MRYGVVVCPNCKKAKGFELSSKTTKCPICNKTLKIDKLKIFYKTDSQVKLRNAIGLINANIDGKMEDFKKLLENRL